MPIEHKETRGSLVPARFRKREGAMGFNWSASMSQRLTPIGR